MHLCLCICICVSDGENLPEQTDLVPSGAIMTECEKEVTLTHTSAHARANPRERPIWEQAHWEQAQMAHGPYVLMARPQLSL